VSSIPPRITDRTRRGTTGTRTLAASSSAGLSELPGLPGLAAALLITLLTTLVMTLLLASPGTAPAAERPPEDQKVEPIGGLSFKDEVELTVVNIDVFVRDKDGTPVEGLTREDFRILQDGDEKPVTNFATFTEETFVRKAAEAALVLPPTPAPEQPDQPAVPPGTDLTEPQPVFIVLYIDNENLKQFDRNRVLRHVRTFIRDVMVPPVQVMVVSYQRSFSVLQPFTDDPHLVLDAIRSVRTHVGARGELETRRGRLLRELRQAYNQRSSTSSTSSQVTSDLYGLVRAYADEVSNNLGFTLQSIRQVGTMTAGLKGRKYMIYISNGLPVVPGKDLMYELAAINQQAPLLSLMAPYNRKRHFDSLASAANAQGMTFYTIDATGLDAASEISAENLSSADPTTPFIQMENLQQSLQIMAEKTGGLAIVNTNDFTKGLEKIKADLFTYYSLGYSISSSGGDKVHSIEVRVPGHPEYQLRHRRTFVEKSLESRVQDRVTTGLMFDVDDNPMQLQTTNGSPAPADQSRWIVPITVSFPMETIALIPEGDDYVGRVVLFVAARDTEGKQSDLQRQIHELRVPSADYKTRGHDRFVIELSLLMEAGSYKVVVGLMDQVTRQASYTTLRTVVQSAE